jgi:capsular polysaccharide transport system permease protein
MQPYYVAPTAALRDQGRTIVALMLRIIRTRFFGHGAGFLLSIGWPFAHILLLLLIHAAIDRAPPFGDSLVLFFATGLVPFLSFQYMSRFIMIAVLHNRPLLAFPAVKLMDLLLAAAILEVLSFCCTIIILAVFLSALGVNYIPANPSDAVWALVVAMVLGFGYGILNALIVVAVPMWMTGATLFYILLYMVSGIFFVVDTMPETIRYYLSFNPVLQTVEWMRSAYYDGYGSILDKEYTVSFAVLMLVAALLIERLYRGRFLILQ